jgi:hypothetical protein
MDRRKVCQLLLVLAALGTNGAAAGHGGWGGGGSFHGGGWGGGHGGWGHGGWGHGGWGHGGWGHGGWGHGGWGHGGWHHHGGCCGWSVGLFWGPGFAYGYPYPYYGYPYYGYPYYGYPYYPYWPVAADGYSAQTQYVERGQGGQADMGTEVPQTAYWYHCAKPLGYYPYVKTCPGGWQRVPARPPGS